LALADVAGLQALRSVKSMLLASHNQPEFAHRYPGMPLEVSTASIDSSGCWAIAPR
jgi:hypothetical protein